MRLRVSLLLAFTLGSAVPAQQTQQSTSDARIARVTSSIRSRVEVVGRPVERVSLPQRMARLHVPGVSIALIDSGRIAWARGFGVKEAGTTDSVTPTTIFEAGSISKPVAATAMLRLVEQGKLSLDEDVNRYLRSWKLPENRFTEKEKVTLRRIASHSAGLTVHGFPGYATDAPIPAVPQVLDGAKPANTAAVRVDTTPGAIWRYSGGGTTIMQLILSDVTGKSFPQLTRELVLEPVGMSNSTYEQPLPEARWAQASRAHDVRGAMVKGRWHVYPEMAAAGLWTTPTDLAKWALAIADARSGKPGTVLARKTTEEMLTVQKAPVGLGPFLGGAGRTFHFGHGGADEGFHADLVYYPETGQGAAIMTNGDAGPGLMQEVMAALREEYGWPEPPEYRKVTPAELDESQLEGVVGEYRADVSPTFSVTLTVRREGSRLMMDGGDVLIAQELIPESATVLVGADSGMRLQVVRDERGRATALRLGGTEAKRVR